MVPVKHGAIGGLGAVGDFLVTLLRISLELSVSLIVLATLTVCN